MILEHTRFYGFQKRNIELGENNTKSIWEIVHDHDHDVMCVLNEQENITFQ